jgi:hypothetical protein
MRRYVKKNVMLIIDNDYVNCCRCVELKLKFSNFNSSEKITKSFLFFIDKPSKKIEKELNHFEKNRSS